MTTLTASTRSAAARPSRLHVLAASNGKIVSDVGANAASYSGANVAQMAATLIDEQADEVVARLYGDYCRNAGFPPPAPRKK